MWGGSQDKGKKEVFARQKYWEILAVVSVFRGESGIAGGGIHPQAFQGSCRLMMAVCGCLLVFMLSRAGGSIQCLGAENWGRIFGGLMLGAHTPLIQEPPPLALAAPAGQASLSRYPLRLFFPSSLLAVAWHGCWSRRVLECLMRFSSHDAIALGSS